MAKITLFGLAGTGKSSTAKLVAEALGYEFRSTGNMFRDMAKEAGYDDLNAFEKEVCEKDPNFDKKLDDKTTEYGQTHDKFIFESRLAWHFIPDSIKICLICPGDARFERIAAREGKTFEQAKTESLEREASIYERFQAYYHIDDLNDPNHFDIVIDSNKNNLQQVVQIILEELAKRGVTPQK